MEENYHRNKIRAQWLLEFNETRQAFGICHPIDTTKEASLTVNHDIERENPVDGVRIGGHFPLEELRQMAIECAIRATEKSVSQFEIGDEDPCVQWNHPLSIKQK